MSSIRASLVTSYFKLWTVFHGWWLSIVNHGVKAFFSCLRWLLVFTRVTCVLRQLGDLLYLFCKVNCHCIYSWIRWLWFRVWWNSHHSLSWCWTRQPNSPREVREVCLQWECLQQVSRDLGLTNHWTRQNIEDQGPFHAMTVLGQRFWHLNYIEEVLDSQKP